MKSPHTEQASLDCHYGDTVDQASDRLSALVKKPYQAPNLISYGDVRDVTLGPTTGFGESGGGPFCAEGVNCP